MRIQDISPKTLKSLEEGNLQTRTLVEGLAIRQEILLKNVFPQLSSQVDEHLLGLGNMGITHRMRSIGEFLAQRTDEKGLLFCLEHPSDTVRGWACFLMANQPFQRISELLNRVRPLAKDPHFGVREWAWLAVRDSIVRDLPEALNCLAGWSLESSENLRRFASESTRPRGVWCSHIKELKKNPELALPLLEPLKSDPSRYVQDSVANWLNDAGKSQPEWVSSLCDSWIRQSQTKETGYICRRAQRNLK